MGRRKDYNKPLDTESKVSGVYTPEARESQLISLAMDLVEQRLRDGTASSQETVHFLKLGSMREKYEREKLENENILLKAKTEMLESQARLEELYSNAIDAMKHYSGTDKDDENVEELY